MEQDGRRARSGNPIHERAQSPTGEPPPDVGVYDRPEGRARGLSAARWLGVVLVVALVAVGAFLLLQFVL